MTPDNPELIFKEARVLGWYVVIMNARLFGMTPAGMVRFWQLVNNP